MNSLMSFQEQMIEMKPHIQDVLSASNPRSCVIVWFPDKSFNPLNCNCTPVVELLKF